MLNKFSKGIAGAVEVVIVVLVLAVIGLVVYQVTNGGGVTSESELKNTGQKVVDEKAGISFYAPSESEINQEDDLLFGTTFIDSGEEEPLIVVGELNESLFASAEEDIADAAETLAISFGEYLYPFPGERVNAKTYDISSDNVSATSYYYEVSPENEDDVPQFYTVVVEFDEGRWWVLGVGEDSSPLNRELIDQVALSIERL